MRVVEYTLCRLRRRERPVSTAANEASWQRLARAEHYGWPVRLVIARCSVDYVGRPTAHLPSALRLLIVKSDGSVLVHSDGGSYQSEC